MDIQNTIRKCPHCGDPLPERSRSDRKYCPVKYGIANFCKNETHNPKTKAEYQEQKGLKKINRINRDILKRLLEIDEYSEISEQQLKQEGFRLEFILNKAQMRVSGNEAFLYLVFGLEVLGNGNYKIFKHGRRF